MIEEQTPRIQALQRWLEKNIYERVLGVPLVNPAAECGFEIKRCLKTGGPDAEGGIYRRPYLRLWGRYLLFSQTRNGAHFTIARLNVHDSTPEDCQRFFRFANLCAARLWKYGHNTTNEPALPDRFLILPRRTLNDDAEKETGLNELIDLIEKKLLDEQWLTLGKQKGGRPKGARNKNCMRMPPTNAVEERFRALEAKLIAADKESEERVMGIFERALALRDVKLSDLDTRLKNLEKKLNG
jgi:hypothetical protein